MTVRDLLASFIRTLVPTVVGLILAALAKTGVEVDGTALSLVVDGLFIGAYYAAVRFLESRWSWVGVFLGWKTAPTYEKAVNHG